MKIKSALQLMVGLLTALSLTAVIALDGERGAKKLSEEQRALMSILDANNDGVISQTESQRHPELAQRFYELDRNNDGIIERAEFARFEVTEKDLERVDDDYRQ